MADTDEEDGYSDDDLDALPHNDFLELEQHAIQSKQAQPDRLAINKLQLLDQYSLSKHHPDQGRNSAIPQKHRFTQEQSSDYGDIDDEILDGGISENKSGKGKQPFGRDLDLRNVDEATLQESWRQQRYGAPHRLPKSYQPRNDFQRQATIAFQQRSGLEDSGYAQKGIDEVMLDAPALEEEDPLQARSQVEDVDALQAKVAEVFFVPSV